MNTYIAAITISKNDARGTTAWPRLAIVSALSVTEAYGRIVKLLKSKDASLAIAAFVFGIEEIKQIEKELNDGEVIFRDNAGEWLVNSITLD